jgi:ankyrin repeat protein
MSQLKAINRDDAAIIQQFMLALANPLDITRLEQLRNIPKENLERIAIIEGSKTKDTLLHRALIADHYEIAELLLQNGAHIFIDKEHRFPPVTKHSKVVNQINAITSTVRQKVTTIPAKTFDDLTDEPRTEAPYTALTYVVAHNRTKMTELLIRGSQFPNYALCFLLEKASDQSERIKSLLALPRIQECINFPSQTKGIPLLLAARKGDKKAFELLCSCTSTNKQMATENLNNFLHEALLGIAERAAIADHKKHLHDKAFTLHLLGQHKKLFIAALHAPNKDGVTPFSLACTLGNYSFITLLAENNIPLPPNRSLHEAAKQGNGRLITTLHTTYPKFVKEMLTSSQDNPIDPYEIALQAEHHAILNPEQPTKKAGPSQSITTPNQWEHAQTTLLKCAYDDEKLNHFKKTHPIIKTRINENTLKKIKSIQDPDLKNAITDMWNQLTLDYEDTRKTLKQKYTKATREEAIPKINKILGLFYELEQLITTFTSEKFLTAEQMKKAKNDFLACCKHKLTSDETASYYAAIIGAIIGLIAGTLLGIALAFSLTGGLASFTTVPTTAHLGIQIGTTLATAITTTLIATYHGATRGQPAKWRTDFFAVAKTIEHQIEDFADKKPNKNNETEELINLDYETKKVF